MVFTDFFKSIADLFNTDVSRVVIGLCSIISLIISTTNFFVSQHEKIRKLSIIMNNIRVSPYTILEKIDGVDKSVNIVTIQFTFSNFSQTSIAISRIQLIHNGQIYESESRPYVVERLVNTENEKVYRDELIKSTVLPIYLNSLGAYSGYIAFLLPANILSSSEKSLSFRIYTTRGKVIENTLKLHEEHQIF